MGDIFSDALDHTLKYEGGYVNNPLDPGGETCYGLTKRTAMANGYTGDMKAIPWNEMVRIYKEVYWERAGLPAVATFLPALAQYMFDIGVNMGTATAGKMLQEALNLVTGSTLTVDGALGPATMTALQKVPATKRQTVRLTVAALHAERYLAIVRHNPTQAVFLGGWLRRVGGGE